MEKKFTLKRYDSIDEVVLASYQTDDETGIMSLEDLKEAEMGGLDRDKNEYQFSYEQQKNGIEEQGYWGWVDENKVIHFWIGKEIPLEQLIHFFAHEIGHETGKKDEDEFEEERRAEGYGETATLAYEFAKQILNTK